MALFELQVLFVPQIHIHKIFCRIKMHLFSVTATQTNDETFVPLIHDLRERQKNWNVQQPVCLTFLISIIANLFVSGCVTHQAKLSKPVRLQFNNHNKISSAGKLAQLTPYILDLCFMQLNEKVCLKICEGSMGSFGAPIGIEVWKKGRKSTENLLISIYDGATVV